jgi:hypothetical protein
VDRKTLLEFVQNRFREGAPAETPGEPTLPGEAVIQEAASFAQDALQVARDPGMDELRFDLGVLFPEG